MVVLFRLVGRQPLGYLDTQAPFFCRKPTCRCFLFKCSREHELAFDFSLFLLADVYLLPAVTGSDISQSGKNYLGCVVFRLMNYR